MRGLRDALCEGQNYVIIPLLYVLDVSRRTFQIVVEYSTGIQVNLVTYYATQSEYNIAIAGETPVSLVIVRAAY